MSADIDRATSLTSLPRLISVGLLLLVLVTLAWTQQLDKLATQATTDSFQRALAAAALARGLNGVISVAQGTEVAITPVGVGVTLSLGEILDPINDLVERFAWLALVASVSIGLQITLAEIAASAGFALLLTLAAMGCIGIMLLQHWYPATSARLLRWSAHLLGLLIFVRFALIVVLLATHWLDQAFLQSRHDEAVAQLQYTNTQIEHLQQQQSHTDVGAADEGMLDQTARGLRNLLDDSRQTLDIRSQLADLQAEVERGVEHLIELIVVFVLQTLLLPIVSLWLCWQGLKLYWRTGFKRATRSDCP